jgi:hypothetical protein
MGHAMNPEDQHASPMDFEPHPVDRTPWMRLLETGRNMVEHFACAPDTIALADARLLFAQFAVASSRQPVPTEYRAQWMFDVSRVCEDMENAITARAAELAVN